MALTLISFCKILFKFYKIYYCSILTLIHVQSRKMKMSPPKIDAKEKGIFDFCFQIFFWNDFRFSPENKQNILWKSIFVKFKEQTQFTFPLLHHKDTEQNPRVNWNRKIAIFAKTNVYTFFLQLSPTKVMVMRKPSWS